MRGRIFQILCKKLAQSEQVTLFLFLNISCLFFFTASPYSIRSSMCFPYCMAFVRDLDNLGAGTHKTNIAYVM